MNVYAQNKFIAHRPKKRDKDIDGLKAELAFKKVDLNFNSVGRICKHCSLRGSIKGRYICHTCKSRNWINKNPERYAYHMLKKSAKKRNLPFTLNFELFKTLCENSGYVKNSGRLFNYLTVERINPDYGYHDNNVMIVPKSFNSAKHIDTFINEDLPF